MWHWFVETLQHHPAASCSACTLGYGVSYAVGTVFLALWGSVIVALMNRG